MKCYNCERVLTGDYEIEKVIFPTYAVERYYGQDCWDQLFGPEYGYTVNVM